MSTTEIDLPSYLEVHGTTVVESSASAFKFNVPVDMASQALTGLPNGSADQDAATKGQLDAYTTATVTAKNGCVVKADSNITLSGTQTIDSVALSVGDRVLVAGQTSGSANGIYVVASGAWSRASDMAASSSAKGVNVAIVSGTVNAGTAWIVTSGTTVGTDTLAFSRLSPSMTQSFLVAGTSTWTKPAGCKQVTIVAFGGGGGGGAGSAATATYKAGGGGGGGGACAIESFDASALPSTVTVTVGAGGTGGAASTSATGNSGNVGGTSSFGTYLKSYGGGGGRGGASITNDASPISGGGGGGTAGAGSLVSNLACGGSPNVAGAFVGVAGAGAGSSGAAGLSAEMGGGSGGGSISTGGYANGVSLRGGSGGGGGGGIGSNTTVSNGGSANGVAGGSNSAGSDGSAGTSLVGGCGGTGGASKTTGGYAGGP